MMSGKSKRERFLSFVIDYQFSALVMNDDFSIIYNFGSENRSTSFFKCEGGLIKVNCGCFHGTINEFRERVKDVHKDSKYAKEYLMIADLMELKMSK